MKVLITTNWTMRAVGGVPSHIADLTWALAQAGYAYGFVNPDERFHSPFWKGAALLKGRGVDAGRVVLTRLRLANLKVKLYRLLAQERFDLIHAHDAFAAVAAVDLGLPVVLTVHGPLSKEIRMLMGNRSPLYLRLARECERAAYARSGRIIAVDSGQRDIIVNEYGVNSDQVRVIPNAVNTELFLPCQAQPAAVRYFLVPRRLVRKNGVEVAVRAMAYLEDPDVELWIVGEGPEEPRLRFLTRKLGIEKRVRFLGSVRDRRRMAHMMSQAQGVIVPSIPVEGVVEATSIAALEAMSCGVPVFASCIGGLVEIIKDLETGFLFEAGSFESLAALLNESLRADRAEATRRVGRAARAHIQERYSLPGWLERVLAVYQEAVSAG